MKLSVLIPCYNEINTIEKILDKVLAENKFQKEIIVVDDFSTDGTRVLLENKINNKIDKLILNQKNFGKGYSLKKAVEVASGDIILVQDADLEYDPNDIIQFIDQLDKNNFDVIMGSRFIGTQRTVLHFWHMVGNKFITLLFNILNNTTFSDIYCCYCLFKRKNVNVNQLKCTGWGQQAEILTFALNKRSKIFEIGISYHGRTYEEGKKIKYYDVFSVIFWIITTKFKKFFL